MPTGPRARFSAKFARLNLIQLAGWLETASNLCGIESRQKLDSTGERPVLRFRGLPVQELKAMIEAEIESRQTPAGPVARLREIYAKLNPARIEREHLRLLFILNRDARRQVKKPSCVRGVPVSQALNLLTEQLNKRQNRKEQTK